VGSSSVSTDVQFVNDAGLPVFGMLAADWPALSVSQGLPGAAVPVTLIDLADISSPWAAGGVKERTGGYYRLDMPNALFAQVNNLTTICDAENKHCIAEHLQVFSGGAGSGPCTVVIVTVSAESGAAPIAGAQVSLTQGGYAVTGVTDSSGAATFNVNAGAYVVAITATGFTFGGATLNVSTGTTQEYALPVMTYPATTAPGQATGALTCYDQYGSVESGVTIYLELMGMPVGDAGNAVDATVRTQVSGSGGTVAFTGMWQGAEYRAWRNNWGSKLTFTVPAGTSLFSLPDLLGKT
jgi:hypothetical protein